MKKLYPLFSKSSVVSPKCQVYIALSSKKEERMKRLIILAMVFCLFFTFGCDTFRGPKGDSGAKEDKGDTGDDGVTITSTDETIDVKVYTGYIPSDGFVYIGSGVLSSDTLVTVLYGFPSVPNTWIELGQSDSADYPYVAVYYDYSAVSFFNCDTTWLYKIIVIRNLGGTLAPGLSVRDYIKGTF